MRRPLFCAAALLTVPLPSAAVAANDQFEFWLNPSIAKAIDDDTEVELEAAQRLRDASEAADTYFLRLWVNQDLSDAATLSGAVERRINDGDADETRLLQQLSVRSGILRGRVRLEQRFVDDARFGARIRFRAGVTVPLDRERKWTGYVDAEPFFTLRSTSRGGQDGLTGLRTQIGVEHQLWETVSVSLTYLRQQDIRRNRPDTVGHAPLIGLELAF